MLGTLLHPTRNSFIGRCRKTSGLSVVAAIKAMGIKPSDFYRITSRIIGWTERTLAFVRTHAWADP